LDGLTALLPAPLRRAEPFARLELGTVFAGERCERRFVVTRRNVNPGDYVQVGQNLMAVRSLSEIWVDANFKETQLRDLRIGQPVDFGG
jgi:membrane fusion protein, multidrug efflux system